MFCRFKNNTYICSVTQKQKDMNTKEIYNLAIKMTEQEVDNVVAGWRNRNETESLNIFNSLVKLGDSKQLACASVIAKKVNNKEESEMYYKAHCL